MGSFENGRESLHIHKRRIKNPKTPDERAGEKSPARSFCDLSADEKDPEKRFPIV
jgi:hypothetical protein